MKKLITIAITVVTLLATLAFPHQAFNFVAADATLRQVTVYDHDRYHHVSTSAFSVYNLMHEIGIALCGASRTNYAPETPIWNGMSVTIERSAPLHIQIDNEAAGSIVIWPNTTVTQVLTQLQNEKGLPFIYGGNYARFVEPNETLPLQSWQTRLETETVVLPYQTHENHTSAVWGGRSHIRQEGSPGEQEIVTEIIYIGGIEQNREIVGDTILTKPVDTIVDIGTARLGARTDVTAPDFHYRRRVRMEATAYTAGYGCTGKHPCDPWYGITASGRRVEHGIVAVDRRVIPLGTRLYVEGYGFAIAADVGGAIRGYKIDLFMEDLSDALRFGRRHLYVWILD